MEGIPNQREHKGSHIRDDPYIITEEDERLSERPVHH